jgi:myosin-1
LRAWWQVFIRNPKTVLKMEDLRRAQTIVLAAKIQAIYRGWKARSAYKKMRSAAIVIACRFKGYRARKKFKATRAKLVLITAFWRMWKERRRLADHMQALARARAAILITKVVRGWVVRKRMAKHFRKNAGPVLYQNLLAFQKRMWLRMLAQQLPPVSPTAPMDLRGPGKFRVAVDSIKRFFHDWRCKLYRDRTPNSKRELLRLKLLASKLFKGRKLSYPPSVEIAFPADHVGLQGPELAPKWSKVAAAQSVNTVLMASKAKKVNRSNGNTIERLVVLDPAKLLVRA